ncbi:MAG: GNAT family N-acetyltransferase [Gammaproteobacteria bacterium]
MPEFEVRLADWSQDLPALREVRTRVFIEEQRVPVALEWDEMDADCVHALAFADDAPIGTGRLTPDMHIGRMAVLAEWRGRGVGSRLLEILMQAARERGDMVCRLNAQTHALDFYTRYGFRTEGEEFIEADIPHQTMVLRLDPSPLPPSGGKDNPLPSPLPPSGGKDNPLPSPLPPSGGKGELEGDSCRPTKESPSRSPFPASQARGRN